jgi:magnesium-transporting ATPase (P-type)
MKAPGLRRLWLIKIGGTNVALSRSMIPQRALYGNDARSAAVSGPKQPTNRVRNGHSLEASSVTHLLEVDPVRGLTPSEAALRLLSYGPNNDESTETRHFTGILVLLFLISVIGFLLTAATLNRAAGDRIEVFLILGVMVVGPLTRRSATFLASRYPGKAWRPRD